MRTVQQLQLCLSIILSASWRSVCPGPSRTAARLWCVDAGVYLFETGCTTGGLDMHVLVEECSQVNQLHPPSGQRGCNKPGRSSGILRKHCSQGCGAALVSLYAKVKAGRAAAQLTADSSSGRGWKHNMTRGKMGGNERYLQKLRLQRMQALQALGHSRCCGMPELAGLPKNRAGPLN